MYYFYIQEYPAVSPIYAHGRIDFQVFCFTIQMHHLLYIYVGKVFWLWVYIAGNISHILPAFIYPVVFHRKGNREHISP